MRPVEAARPGTIARDSRADRLDALIDAAGQRAIALVAPPGYGKSQALQRLRRRAITHEHRVALLDGRALSGVADLAAALAQPVDDAQEPLAQLDDLVSGTKEPLTILIDNADRLTPAMATLLDAYLADQRTECRLVLAGRSLPEELQLDRHRAYGRIRIFDVGIMGFRQMEALELINHAQGSDASLRDAVDLATYADDWPVAVDLAARGDDEEGASGERLGWLARAVPEWLDEHVYAELSPDQRSLLHGISILADDALDTELVAATCEIDDAAAALADIARRTPLVRADRSGGYRLRPFARTYLQRRMTTAAGKARRQHLRAARFFHTRGEPSRAIPHALAAQRADLTRDWMTQALRDAVGRGNMADAVAWLQNLSPRDQPLRDVDTIVWAIWALAVGGFTDRARLWLIELSQAEREPRLDAHERGIVETLLASIDDDVDRGLAQMAPFLNAGDGGLALPMAGLRANCLRWINQQVGSEMADPIAPTGAAIAEVEPQEVYRHCMMAFRYANVLLDRGRSQEALRFLEPARAVAEAQGVPSSMPLQIVSSALAAARRQHGDGISARLALAACDRDASRLAIPDVLWLARSTTARLAADEGDWGEALAVLAGLEDEARSRSLPRLVALSLAETARVVVRAGELKSLEPLLIRLRDVHDAASNLGSVQERLVQLAANIGIGHAALALEQGTTARIALQAAAKLAATHRRHHDLAEITLLLDRIEPAGSTAVHIDEADRRRLLRDVGQLREHKSASVQVAQAQPVPILTAKETEIIELLSAGLSNKRIAAAMLVSAETVKWHLKNIFNKLDVHDREHVIAYAREHVVRR